MGIKSSVYKPLKHIQIIGLVRADKIVGSIVHTLHQAFGILDDAFSIAPCDCSR